MKNKQQRQSPLYLKRLTAGTPSVEALWKAVTLVKLKRELLVLQEVIEEGGGGLKTNTTHINTKMMAKFMTWARLFGVIVVVWLEAPPLILRKKGRFWTALFIRRVRVCWWHAGVWVE